MIRSTDPRDEPTRDDRMTLLDAALTVLRDTVAFLPWRIRR